MRATLPLLLFACAHAHLELPEPLATAARLPVDRPTVANVGKQTWTFGGFVASDVKAGWTTSTTRSDGPTSLTNERQTLSFALATASDESLAATCLRGGLEQTTEIALGTSSSITTSQDHPTLICTFTPPSGDAWTLAWRGGIANGEPAGHLRRGEIDYAIEDLPRKVGEVVPDGPAGHALLRDGRALAAVDLSGKGTVVIHPDLDPPDRAAVGAAAVALLQASLQGS